MLDGLDAIAWDTLEHGGGPAGDIPGQLRSFLDVGWRKYLVGTWHGTLMHQGTPFPAAPVAMPFLVELAEHADGPHREMLRLLAAAGFPVSMLPTGECGGASPDRGDALDPGGRADPAEPAG